MKRLFFSCFLFAFCILGTNAQQIVFTPKWTAQAQFAGYYVADEMGFYKDEGLDVVVQHPTIGESSFSFLEKGRAQIVVMNLSYAITAKAAGSKIVNIMQTSQSNSLMLVGHFPLKDIASLQNQRIAVWNHLSQDLLEMLAEKYKLNIEWVRFNSGINLFLSGAVDICLVGSYNEYPQLAEFGMEIDSTHVFRLADFGYDLPEDGVYVTEEYYNQHKDIIQKFVKASVRGWMWANENREKTLDIVMKRIHKDNIGTNRYHQRKMLEEVLRLQCEKGGTERSYKLGPAGFERAMNSLFPADRKACITYQEFVK